MMQENASNTLPIGVNIAGNEPISYDNQANFSRNKAKQIKFLANSLGMGQNRAARRRFAAHIRKQMKGVKIDA